MIYQNGTESMKSILFSFIDNPQDVELAAFLLKNGFSIRDYFLFKDILELIRCEWDGIIN